MPTEDHLYVLPPDSTPFFGANPAWSREREGHVDTPVPGSAQGKIELPYDCSVCGGQRLAGTPRDPLKKSELTVFTCPACFRTHHEGQFDGKIDPKADGTLRGGKMLRRVIGKTDPDLNAYLRERTSETAEDTVVDDASE